MNPDVKANAMLHMQDNKEMRKMKNDSIKKRNRDIRFRNFIRKHK